MSEELCRFRPPEKGLMAIWEITNFCNLQCKHCCTNSSPLVSRANDVPTRQILKITKEISKLSGSEIYFSGGEPFLRKDLLTILESIDSTLVNVYIATNGYKINEATALRLKNMDIKGVTISLDGHTPELHNFIRLSPDAFARAVKGIKSLISADVPVRVSSTITSYNCAYMEDFISFLSDLGVRSISWNTALPVGRAVEYMDIIPSVPQAENILDRLDLLKEKYRHISINESGEMKKLLTPNGCPAGEKVLHITAEGDVSPCSWLYKLDKEIFTLGNIKQNSLSECLQKNVSVMEPYTSKIKNCPIPYVYSKKFSGSSA